MYSLIVVDYNSIEKTISYIETFCNAVVEMPHTIIIDNSPDKQSEFINSHYANSGQIIKSTNVDYMIKYETNFGEIIYCWSGENLGYAKGNNLGTQVADELYEDEYYIISNNDIRFKDSLDLTKFEDIFEAYSDIAVIGPRVVGLDEKEQSPHKKIGVFKYLFAGYWFRSWPFRWRPDYDYTNESKRCYRVMGSFLCIRADAFRKAHRFDPNTFMFAEEMILSERLAKVGYGCYFCNDVTVVHEHGISVKQSASRLLSEQWSFESCCYYFKEYRNASDIVIGLAKLNFRLYKFRIRIRILVKQFLQLDM